MKSMGPETTQQYPRPLRPKRQPRFRRLRRPTYKEVLVATGVATALLAVLFWVTLPDVTKRVDQAPDGAIQIFDRHGKLVTTLDGDEEREFVPIAQIPKHMQQAIMAAEDHQFFSHHGLSFRGIGRALLANAEAGHVVEGGSTLTQQLAKILFFDHTDRSVVRKLREAAVAMQLEQKYTKPQILEMYLNQVYFGRGSYGIERASIRYFGHGSRKLTLPESAFLAGIVRQPSYLGSRKHLKDAQSRQSDVLDAMAELGNITPAAAKQAKTTKLAFMRTISPYRKFPYYTSAVTDFLHTQFKADVLKNGGMRVYTNLDQAAQNAAEQTLSHGVPGAPANMNQAGLASVSVKDGAVLALVGGIGSFWKHQWNAATHPHTMGSSFKPFVYLSGFERGTFSPDSLIQDDPIVVHVSGQPDWEPKNFDNDYLGYIPVREAVAKSRNICAVRAASAVGIGYVIDTAKRAGLTAKLDPPYLTLALGSAAASPLDMAGAYATFARNGYVIPPQLVRRIDGHNGTLKEFTPSGTKAFQTAPLQMLISCLQGVVERGTGIYAKLPGRDVAGKTGTSDGGRDLWFVGFTPDTVTAVWGGNDNHQALPRSATGGMLMTGVWKRYMQAFYKAHPEIPKSSFEASRSTEGSVWDTLLKPTPQPNQVRELSDPTTPLDADTRSQEQTEDAEDSDDAGRPQAEERQSGIEQGSPAPQSESPLFGLPFGFNQQRQQDAQQQGAQQQQQQQQGQQNGQQQSGQYPEHAPDYAAPQADVREYHEGDPIDSTRNPYRRRPPVNYAEEARHYAPNERDPRVYANPPSAPGVRYYGSQPGPRQSEEYQQDGYGHPQNHPAQAPDDLSQSFAQNREHKVLRPLDTNNAKRA